MRLRLTTTFQRIGLILGPVLAVLVAGVGPPPDFTVQAWNAVAVTALMGVWWCTEAVPLAITSLIPLAVFPLLGIAPIGEVAPSYVSPSFFLLFAGMLLALGMERWNLHYRLALSILTRAGQRPAGIIGGFMLASFLLSMWISNTAITLMMLPSAMSVAAVVAPDRKDPDQRRFSVALVLGVAYATTIGGVATLVGTPPNLLLAGYLEQTQGIQLTFATWLTFGLPLSLFMLPLAWWALTKIALPFNLESLPEAMEHIRDELAKLGRFTVPEKRTMAVLATVACTWMCRPLVNRLPGLEALSDTGVAVIGAIVLFSIPSGDGSRLLNAKWAKKAPWDVMIMYGGALALAAAVARVGLAEPLGARLSFAAGWPSFALIVLVVGLVLALTELAQNSAAVAISLPIIAALAGQAGVDPRLLAIPGTMAASYAFMLPVSTPPNTIVYGTGMVTTAEMSRAGLLLNIAGLVAIPAVSWIVLVALAPSAIQ